VPIPQLASTGTGSDLSVQLELEGHHQTINGCSGQQAQRSERHQIPSTLLGSAAILKAPP
jgi:hypothetical protein